MSILKIVLHLQVNTCFYPFGDFALFHSDYEWEIFNYILVQGLVNDFRNKGADRFLFSSIRLCSEVFLFQIHTKIIADSYKYTKILLVIKIYIIGITIFEHINTISHKKLTHCFRLQETSP